MDAVDYAFSFEWYEPVEPSSYAMYIKPNHVYLGFHKMVPSRWTRLLKQRGKVSLLKTPIMHSGPMSVRDCTKIQTKAVRPKFRLGKKSPDQSGYLRK